MAGHTVNQSDRFISDGVTPVIVPGDTYDVSILGGTYELCVTASTYGAGVGIVVSRVMPDGTALVEIIGLTADAEPSVLYLTPGKLRFAFAADVEDMQVIFGRVG